MWMKAALLGLAATLLLLPSAGLAQQPIRWEVTLENAQRVAGQTNRLVLIEFTTPTCAYCKRLEAEVFSQPSFAPELASNYVLVKINPDHFPATAKQYGVTGLPTTVIVTPQGQVLDTIQGWVAATEYMGRLNRVAANAKQRGTAVYAQLPGRAASPAVAQPAPTQPATASPTDSRYADVLGRNQPAPATSNAVVSNAPPGATSVQPPPSYTQPTPGYGQSAPRYAQQAPSYGQASPSYAQPQPAYGQPAPNYAQPAPGYGQPGPNYAQSQPSYGQPSPSTPPAVAGAQAYLSSQPPLNSPPVVGQSPSGAGAEPAYGAPSAPLLARQPMSPAPSGAVAQPSGGNSAFGLDGFCPVSLLEKQQWVPGDRRWGMTHRGRTYLFAGPEEQARFARDPDRYAPVVSGNDVVLATEQGQTVTGMREHGVFFGNRVYLFSSEATLEKFAKNPNLYANQALEALRSGAYPGRLLR